MYGKIESGSIHNKERGMLGAVSDSLKKLPFPMKGKNDPIPHITIMNVPPLAAKRDAAYMAAISILQDKITSPSAGEILIAYTDALKLLNISEKAHKAIASAVAKTGRKTNVDSYGVYLRLLSDMLTAALFVVSSSSVICADESTISYLLGSPKAEKIREILSLFSDCEADIRKTIADLYTQAGKTVEKEREKMKRHFNQDEKERYEKSFKEFMAKFD